MASPKFSCVSCGNQTFPVKHKTGTYTDLIGSVCPKCRTKVTEAHIKAFAIKVAEKITGHKLKK